LSASVDPMRFKALVAFLACLVVPAATASTPAAGDAAGALSPVLSPAQLKSLEDKLILRYHAFDLPPAVVDLAAASVQSGQPFLLPFRGEDLAFDMHVSQMFAPEVFAENPGVVPLQGTVLGVPDATAALTLDVNLKTVTGLVQFGEEMHYVEPVETGVGGMHVWYHSDDALIPPQPGEDIVLGDPAPHPEETLEGHASEAIETEAGGVALEASTPIGGLLEVPGLYENETGGQTRLASGLVTYRLQYLRMYRDDAAFDVISIVNLGDVTYSEDSGIRIHFYVLSTTTVNTDTYPDATSANCGPPLSEFETRHPQTGTGHTYNDRAYLFTNNANINFAGWLGCGEQPGGHAYGRFTGSQKQKHWIFVHESGHNSGAAHDTAIYRVHCHIYDSYGTCSQSHNHYSIMNPSYVDEYNIEMVFSQTSKNSMGFTARYKAQIWVGSDVSSHGVKLTYWEVRYPSSPTWNSELRLVRTWSANSGSMLLARSFVGARDCASGDTCNRDFGHITDQVLTTSPTTNSWSYTLNKGTTTWRFWPAYQFVSSWGPYEWHKISLAIP
jgi:hypothetical protein